MGDLQRGEMVLRRITYLYSDCYIICRRVFVRHWKPIMIENSKIPVWLSYLAPINIGAITLGFIVISRDTMSEQTRNHETIHFQQYLDLLFVGFILLYLWDWVVGLFIHKSGNIAYYSIRAEQEAVSYTHLRAHET